MELEAGIAAIEELVIAKAGRRLTTAERALIRGAWEDLDYAEIAAESGYSAGRLQRDIGIKFWNFLTGVLGQGEKVRKKRLREIVEQYVGSRGASGANTSLSEATASSPVELKILGGTLPSVPEFYGRKTELASLREIVADYQLVALVGPEGIGKSALAAKLLQLVTNDDLLEFDFLIWKSMYYAPKLDYLLRDLLKLLIEKTDSTITIPKELDASTDLLIKLLTVHRSLIVLDEAEKLLLSTGDGDDYKTFFRKLIEDRHESCIVLTSREPMPEIAKLQGLGRLARYIIVEGLGRDALSILASKKLTDEEVWGELILKYKGNPSDLIAVADTIQEFFRGRTSLFLKRNTTLITDSKKESLDLLFKGNPYLTDIEKTILFYLATKGQASFSNLLQDLKEVTNSTTQLTQALKRLADRSLVEKVEGTDREVSFTIESVLQKYLVTNFPEITSSSNGITK